MKFIESTFKPHFSSTHSAVDVEVEFEHNLKPEGKKRRKRKSNLSLNQSKKKGKSITMVKLSKLRSVMLKKTKMKVTVKMYQMVMMLCKVTNSKLYIAK